MAQYGGIQYEGKGVEPPTAVFFRTPTDVLPSSARTHMGHGAKGCSMYWGAE